MPVAACGLLWRRSDPFLGGPMLLRARSKTALCLSVVSFLFTPAIAKHQKEPDVALTCDRRAIDAESYEMATIGQARTLLTDRADFWDAFRINQHISTLRYLNLDVQELAERALERDPRNMMAHSILARQYAILGREREADRRMDTRCRGGRRRRVDRDPLRCRLQELLSDVVRPRCPADLPDGAVYGTN